MKRLLFAGMLAAALLQRAEGQPASVFINNGTITTPPVIDATNFINNGIFDIAFNSFTTVGTGTLLLNTTFSPFEFSDVLTYTNRGFMAADTGFIFDDAPSSSGARHASGTFGNGNLGQISAGSFTNAFFGGFVFFVGPGGTSSTGNPTLSVTATNIVNTGLLDVGLNGFIGLGGNNLNLSRGTLHVEGLDDFNALNSGNNIIFNGESLVGSSLDFGVFDQYWGVGNETNQINFSNLGMTTNTGGGFTGEYFSPSAKVTFFPATPGFATVSPPASGQAFQFSTQVNPSNFIYQVVFVNTNIAANGVVTDVRFLQGDHNFQIPIVQWSSVVTNNFSTHALVTNTLYLEDAFGTQTNLALVTNGVSLTGQNFLIPTNYAITRFFGGFSSLSQANGVYDGSIFAGIFPFTNQYSALGVQLQPVTVTPDPSSKFSTVTNVPGRIQLTATNSLDLTRTIMTGANYVRLTATNHFVGSTNAQMIYPFADINLGTTNGMLNVSNLVAPDVPRFDGTIAVYSARWTNIIAGVTNEYHILMVDAEIQPTAPVQLITLSLRSTNIFISDILNVSSNLLLNAQQITITSNGCGAANSFGEINVASPNILWNPSFPVLKNLTNSGIISVSNTIYLAGVRSNPYFTSNFTEPYQSVVNHGVISSSGISVWANYFENTGGGAGLVTNCDGSITNTTNFATIFSSFGPFSLQASNALLANGVIESGFVGDISITSGTLSISNHALFANGALTLTVTNLLTDTGTNSDNFWEVADGINLPILPAAGDLLGTTISNVAPGNLQVQNVWAGQDRGPNTTGFLNNAALGHLVLDGGNTDSTFLFSGPGAQNAIYVDLIELQNGATNRASTIVNGQTVQSYTAVDASPGMTIYFADAIASGQDISEKLNGNITASGGQVVWVPSYAGFFSSTNVTYPSGQTYSLNRALVLSTDIDSNGNGTNNAFDPEPVFVGEDVKLTLTLTNTPGLSSVISWQTLAGATNNLFTSTVAEGGVWTLVTNFVSHVNGPVAVTNSAPGVGPRYYKVRVDPPQP